MRIAQFIGLMILAGLLSSASGQAPSPIPTSISVGPYIEMRPNLILGQSTYNLVLQQTGDSSLALQRAIAGIDTEAKLRLGAALDVVRQKDPELYRRISTDYGFSVIELSR